MMEEGVGLSLWALLGEMPNHRSRLGRRFTLRSVLGLTRAALLAGRKSLAAIARWGRKLNKKQMRELEIDRPKTPCQATYHNVFKGLKVETLEQVLAAGCRGFGGRIHLDSWPWTVRACEAAKVRTTRGCTFWLPTRNLPRAWWHKCKCPQAVTRSLRPCGS